MLAAPQVDDAAASMEPRCEHRGEIERRIASLGLDPASMEPRCEHRGETRGDQMRVAGILGFNGAAVRTPRRGVRAGTTCSFVCTLQWSRGANTAESFARAS